jgi:hypothetical protein
MKDKNFEQTLSNYIFNPEHFWPNSSLFHKRNIDKIVKARYKHENMSDIELVSTLKDHLEQRYKNKNKTMYVLSCGSSGCHFIGEMLSSIPGFDLIKEVYYPPAIIDLIDDQSFKQQRISMLFDAVSYFPSRGLKLNNPSITPVNIMHLRPDVPTDVIKKIGNNHVVLLLRNPFDIVYSLAFRKDEYKSESDPEATEIEYLRKKINHVKKFYKMILNKRNTFDNVVRYEDLLRNPYTSIYDILLSSKNKFEIEWGERKALDNAIDLVNNESTINYNSKKKEISKECAKVMIDSLGDLARELGYQKPSYVSKL